MLATALAAEDPLPPLPPPDRQRLGQYHSDPLLAPHLDVYGLGGITEQGDAAIFGAVELRLGGTFAFGVGASKDVLDLGPTLTWAWRLFSYRHYWSMDLTLRTPVPGIQAFQVGLGGDMSPQTDGRWALRIVGLIGGLGFSGELGVVVRAF